ncbi:MAG: sterol desaturase family protein [Pseudomonadales bacterium]|nr:sterol desaturase family protein [Pseudomonadales bacterium]
MDYVVYAVPFFLVAIILEISYGFLKNNNTYRLNDSVSSLFMGSLRTLNKLVIIGFGGYFFAAIETHYALWRMDTNSWMTWLFAFIAYDLCYYWFHRISHERQIFWAAHVAHHQSEDYNLSTALRQTGTGALITWVFFMPLFWIGVPSTVVVSVASINLIYQFWVHSEHIPKLGWVETFFVTASNHRVHHAQNDEYMDKNYGGVFILWDRLFGTFKEEENKIPCVYGIRGSLKTFNPLWANLHIYVKILKEMITAKDWKEKLYAPFARTSWQPQSVSSPIAKEKFNVATFTKFNPQISLIKSGYAFAQLLVLTWLGFMLLESTSFTYAQLCIIVGMMAFTMYSTSLWLDGKTGFAMEIIRLSVCMFLVAYAYQADLAQSLAAGLFIYTLINVAYLLFMRRYEVAVSFS